MLMLVFTLISYYLWSISKPGKTGIPQIYLSNDIVTTTYDENLTDIQLQYERIILKTFVHYSIPLVITPGIRTTFKRKLWRMGQCYSKLGTKNRSAKLEIWKNQDWEFSAKDSELKTQLIAGKRKAEVMLHEEVVKRQKLEQDIAILKSKDNYQESVKRDKKSYLTTKNWNDCTRQQQYNRKKNLAENVRTALKFCDHKGFEPTV